MIEEISHSKFADQGFKPQAASRLGRIMKSVKNSIYSIMFVLLKDEDESNFLKFAVQTGVDYMQMVQFLFDDKVIGLWNANELFSSIFSFYNYFNIGSYFQTWITWELFLGIFYLFIFVIFVIIIDIVYVSIAFNRKKFNSIWPLWFLRNFVNIAVTILFLPITESMLKMIDCSSDSNRGNLIVHKDYGTVVCYQGTHLFHSIISILFTAIFVTISIVVALNYFETRMNSPTIVARSNSRAEVCFIINKIVLQIWVMIFDDQWILVVTFFAGSAALLYYYVYDDAYYNKMVAQFYKILSSIYFWSCFMLIVLKVLESQQYKGGPVIWAFGIPFVALLALGFSRNTLKRLTKNQIKFESAQELIDHLRFVLLLVENHRRDKDSYLVLVGYIQKHKLVCPNPLCPLKINNLKLVKSEEEESKSWMKKLLLTIEIIYEQGIRKFRNSARLRITFAFFLIERLNNKKKALEQLIVAETLNPNFEEEFLIYRYKKIIDEKLDEQGGGEPGEEVDIVGIIAFETHLRLCVEFIKKASENQRDFWSELLEERPSLVRLSSIGNGINFNIKNAKENWAKLYKLNSSIPSVLRLYSKFLVNIVNEKETGKKLMDQFRVLLLKQQELLASDYSDLEHIHTNTPLAVFHFQANEAGGLIRRVNKFFCAFSGWTEEELIGQKMEFYMPNILKSLRSTLISSFFNSGLIEAGRNEIREETFVRRKNGAIVFVESTLRLAFLDANNLNSAYIVHTIRPIESISQNIYLLTNKLGIVFDSTSNGLTFLRIEFERLISYRYNLHLILPKDVLVDYSYRGKGCEMMFEDDMANREVTCTVSPLRLSTAEDKNQFEGYIVCVDVSQFSRTNQEKTKVRTQSTNKGGAVRFRNIWEVIEPVVNERHALHDRPDCELDSEYENEEREVALRQKDPAFGRTKRTIVTKRLWRNEIEDLHEKKFYHDGAKSANSDFIVDNVKHSIFHESIQNYNDQVETKHIKGRKNLLIQLINKKQKIFKITFFKLLSFLWVLLVLALCYFSAFNSFGNFTGIYEKIQNIQNSLVLFEEIPVLLTHCIDLQVLLEDASKDLKPEEVDSVLQSQSAQIEAIKAKIFGSASNIVDCSKFINNYGNDTIRYMIAQSQSELFAASPDSDPAGQPLPPFNSDYFLSKFDYKIGRMLSLAINIARYGETDLSFFLVKINLVKNLVLNDFLFELMREIDDMFEAIVVQLLRARVLNRSLYAVLIISVILSIAFLLYFCYVRSFVRTQTEEILLLFFDIPRNDVSAIHRKCEKFLGFCNVT